MLTTTSSLRVQACSKLSGFKRLALGPALEENRFVRTAWADLEPGTDLAAAAAELNGQKVRSAFPPSSAPAAFL